MLMGLVTVALIHHWCFETSMVISFSGSDEFLLKERRYQYKSVVKDYIP
ncbi:Uncharacterised protein [Kluyvera cryocrescens]|uniref:Uncharacterized protein n=1 Tax=Kluyvera cryocrescens TaxID=580 RepID=A0A485AN25_KLUCR|nr:Uncharacterised protein [Kluyvera cryocrescens]